LRFLKLCLVKNLLIDVGNTLIKTALSDSKGLTDYRNWESSSDLANYVDQLAISIVFISSVTDKHEDIVALLKKDIAIKIFSKETPLPIKVHYKTKETLGLDRIAAIMGAYELFPSKNSLVIDIGTCITYDFLDENGNYHGGGISPGIGIRLKSLHDYTSKLPNVDISQFENQPAVTGDSSVNSILSGVLNGILFEIEGFISAYSGQYEFLNTIITGGDSYRFESTIKAPIFVAPKLILIGLNRILKENDEN